jgi:TonB-linked SusC/RagA family outer membrane protein
MTASAESRRERIGPAMRAALVCCTMLAAPVAAQAPVAGKATVTGIVRDAQSQQPVPGAVVNIPGTPLAATTDERGRYTLRGVPFGNQTIDAKRVGYSQVHDVNVRVNTEQFVHDITMSQVALSLEAITTAATVDPTSGTKAPFAIATLTAENLPVPSTGIAQNLQGKVAGLQVTRASGATGGDEPWLQIRSIQSPGNRGASPLIIVDGVPLNMVRQTNSGTTVSTSGAVGQIAGAGDELPVRSSDIQGLDIESIEIIKGAAASALYGSEAASGVISIKTRRGNDLGLGKSQIEVRTDYGVDQIVRMPSERSHHQFLVNGQGQWIDANGALVAKANRLLDPDLMVQHNYASIYDPVDQIFQPNQTMNTTLRMSHMSERNNFHASYTRTREPGIIRDAYGSSNQSVRVNVDHRPRDNVQLSMGVNHSEVHDIPASTNFVQLFTFDPDVNLLAPGDQFGTKYKVSPDSANPTILNPLYVQSIAGNYNNRSASQLSANAQFRPLNWLTLNGSLGYNKQDGTAQVFTPPGLPSDEAGGVTTGTLSYTEQHANGLEAHGNATFLRDIGRLTSRFTFQMETSRRHFLQLGATGTNYPTIGSQTLTAATLKDATSFQTESRVNAGFGSLAMDYDGRYIGDFLVRREGNSLYGPRSRYSTFARASGAWVVSRESWWPSRLASLNLAKLRYSYGTSGTEPDFNDQFEAVSVSSTGFVRGRLGNPTLLPEQKIEHEMGADFIFKSRASLSLTYARSRTRNGILEVEAPNITGFNTYTRNATAAHGDALEASLEGLLYQKRNFKWSVLVNADRSRSFLDTYGRSCYNNTPQFVYICAGVPITEYYGSFVMTSKDQLAKSRSKTPDAWEVNDEGYLVPVGVGNHWYQGMSKHLWGTNVVIDGITYNWGVPQPQWDDSAAAVKYAPIGNWQPTINYGIGNRFSYNQWQFYVLLSGVKGGQIVDAYREWTEQTLNAVAVDQSGRPDSLKKPYLYYLNLPGGGKTTGLTAQNGTATKNNNLYVEPASFMKLAEVQVTYTLDAKRHPALNRLGADRMVFELNGTNLLRFDNNYKGLDQEGFYTLSDHQLIKFDGIRYPLARRFTTAVTLVF